MRAVVTANVRLTKALYISAGVASLALVTVIAVMLTAAAPSFAIGKASEQPATAELTAAL